MSTHVARHRPAVRRWPAVAAAVYVSLFCLIASTALVWDVARGGAGEDSAVVLLAILLRLVTIAMAIASVYPWGRVVPAWMLLAGLWGAAAVQLAYPIAETVVKGLILTGAMAPIDKGISDMSATGWFNFAAAWAVWGVPGVLFTLAALSYGRRHPVRRRWVVLGVLGGAALLAGLGILIG
ncbi:hypothetical protein ACFFMR_05210 [Micromonospora andamanensis]|uniref:Uncharacterized protein n=1 Tax=Micromonospora andamanensis TaxID=1287068 RepID=A0ABQ4I288_9ACTN|nr:hypothetical protein [Micromonospora andamanensis]GIJ11916.1 hypothetical protein Van01_51300 [Micromonospora andamanensis]